MGAGSSQMSLFSWFAGASTSTEIPDIFPIPIGEKDFVSIDCRNIYSRILTDVLERTQGIPEAASNLLWDNCLANNKQEGLVTLVATAMVDKSDLYLVYNKALKVIRKADATEQSQIRADYLAKGESPLGVYITFKNYTRTDMVKFYSQLEYCAVGGLWKKANVSKALQIKINDLRASTAVIDSEQIKTQAKLMAEGLKKGNDIISDAKDLIESADPKLDATSAMIDFIAQKQSFYLGLPASYLTGLPATSTLSDTGKADTKATERGLKNYYFSIAKPVIEGIFGGKTSYKSEDTDGISTALETLKTMDITSDEYLSKDNKTLIVNKSFGLDENEKGDEPDPEIDPEADQTGDKTNFDKKGSSNGSKPGESKQ